MINLDLYLFNLINGFAGKWLWLDNLEMFFAQYFEWFLWLTLILFLVINTKKNWKMFLEAFLAAIISKFILAEIIRWIWFRPRPFVSLNFIPLISQSAEESAFPSGHASFYFALSTIVYIYNKKIGIAFYIATILITILFLVNDSIKTAEDIEKYLNLTTLGTIPIFDSKIVKKRKKQKKREAA